MNSTERDLRKIARITICLIFSAKTWINRRVDSVSFSDPASITRHVSVDFTMPEILIDGPRVDGCVLIPIAMLQKSEMTNLSTQTEQNETWPLYALEDTLRIERYMLEYWQDRCAVKLGENRKKWIDDILKLDPEIDQSGDRFDQLIKTVTPWSSGGRDIRKSTFCALAKILARDRILFAKEEIPDARRVESGYRRCRVFKFTYDRPFSLVAKKTPDELAPASIRLNGKRRCWKITNVQMVITAASPTYARHYHMEFNVPSDVAISEAILYDERTGDPLSSLRHSHATRCDLYDKEDHQVAAHKLARAFFLLTPARRPWTTVTVILSAIVTLLLGGVGVAWYIVPPSSTGNNNINVAIPVLVALAGILFPVVAQPEENNFSRFLLRRFRQYTMACIATSAISIVAGVCLLIVQPRCAWTPLVVGALFALPFTTIIGIACVKFSAPLKTSVDDQASTTGIQSIARKPFVYYQPWQLKWGRNKKINSYVFEQGEISQPLVRKKIEKNARKNRECHDWKIDANWWE